MLYAVEACNIVSHAALWGIISSDNINLNRTLFNYSLLYTDAIPSADQIRITPSLRSQRGSAWTKNRVKFEHWEAEVTFRVSGRGRMGADGLVREATSQL